MIGDLVEDFKCVGEAFPVQKPDGFVAPRRCRASAPRTRLSYSEAIDAPARDVRDAELIRSFCDADVVAMQPAVRFA